jgi:hypothetical protein
MCVYEASSGLDPISVRSTVGGVAGDVAVRELGAHAASATATHRADIMPARYHASR